MKTILISTILVLSFIFSTGCTKVIEVPRYVEASCPKIEVLSIVPLIEISTDSNGSVTTDSVSNLLKGAKQLRKAEAYYIEQITNYNKEFIDK